MEYEELKKWIERQREKTREKWNRCYSHNFRDIEYFTGFMEALNLLEYKIEDLEEEKELEFTTTHQPSNPINNDIV